jgi:hypothetical protein
MEEKKKLSPEDRKERARKAARVRWSEYSKGVRPESNDSKDLVAIMPSKGVNPSLPNLGIHSQVEIDGIGMGVLSDGTPFLAGRGLSRLCGVVQRQIQNITAEWINEDKQTPRVKRIKEILQSHSVQIDYPYLPIRQRSGIFYAYPDVVCLAILEYYAFDAEKNKASVARKNYRLLAGKALRDFIYTQVGYDPENTLPDKWKQFHDRVSLTYNSVPKGYFGIFKEMSDMIVTLGQAGLYIDKSFVPDISVGQHWSKHWTANLLDNKFGKRMKYDHCFPSYFPQADSNPQDCWCYPESALGEFRRWFRDVYIGAGKLQNYLEGKVARKELPVSFAQLAIAAYGVKEIE